MGSNVLIPTSKVTAAAVAGAIVTILTWIANFFFHVDLSATLTVAVQLVVMAISAYMKKEKRATE